MKHFLLLIGVIVLTYVSAFSQCTSYAGIDTFMCANTPSIQLIYSTIGGGATGGTWTSSGTGSFSPDANTLNASYVPSPADITAGSVTLTLTTTGCGPISDQLTLTISPTPTSNAGSDLTACANNSTVTLNGTVTNASGGLWSTSGTGTFTNATALSTNYTPSAAELSSGIVALTLTTTGNGLCSAASDTTLVLYTPAPSANAGADQTTCVNNSSVSLNGSVTHASGGIWSTSGTGTFTIATALSTTYTASAADLSSGTVTLTLTTTGNVSCNAVSDQMIISFTPAPTINAGSDLSICSNSTAPLNGSVTSATGGTWSGGSGTFTPNANTLDATYTPSMAEISSGSVTLSLTSTGNGSCSAVTSQMIISFMSAATANAGPDQAVCGNSNVSLNGTTTVATGGTWSTTGTGSFSNTNALSTTYTPSASDITSDTISIILTTTGNGSCSSASDRMTVTFTPSLTVNAGPDQTICSNGSAGLNGSVNSGYATWSTNGSGSFLPSNNDLNAIYYPSLADIGSGSVTLTLTSSNSCFTSSDQQITTIVSGPSADAGSDQELTASQISISGAVVNATGGIWTTSGSGAFGNPNALSTTYTPSTADLTMGNVVLTLTTTGNGSCTAASDQLVLTTICNVTINSAVTGNTVSLTADNSGSVNVGSYSWEFGDGTSATGKDQTHIYSQVGSYYVTIDYLTSDKHCLAADTIIVNIATISTATYNLSGQVKANANNLDKGIVDLFKLNTSTNQYDLIYGQTIYPADNGSYLFSNLENGTYLAYAMLDSASTFYSSYRPAYYGGSDTWTSALTIQVNGSDVTSKNVELIAYVSPDVTWNTGNDTIQGNITFDQSVVLKLTAASINPVENAVVMLYNSNGDLLTSTHTDAFGNYIFTKLIAGNYTVKVEYGGGVAATSSIPVSVDGNSSTKSVANTEILKQAVTTGISSPSVTSIVNAYPNPTADNLFVEVSSDINLNGIINIYDLSGKQILNSEYSLTGSKFMISVQSLEPGFYIAEIISDKKVLQVKFFKK